MHRCIGLKEHFEMLIMSPEMTNWTYNSSRQSGDNEYFGAVTFWNQGLKGIVHLLQKCNKCTHIVACFCPPCRNASMRHYWLGGMSLFRMDIPLRFFLHFSNNSDVPRSFFRLQRSIPLKCIWLRSLARRRYDILLKKRDYDGAGIPHLELYHAGALLSRMLDWFHHDSLKQWVTLESDLSPVTTDFPSMVASYWSPTFNTAKASTFFTPILWYKVITTSLCPGPLTPILGNHGFLPGLSNKGFLCCPPSRPSPILQSLTPGGLISLGELPLLFL